MLAANLDRLANRAFILRWESGRRRPMDEAFDAYVDIVIAGLEALVRQRGQKAARRRRIPAGAKSR